MSTTVSPLATTIASPELVITASTHLVSSVRELLDMQSKVARKFEALVAQATDDVNASGKAGKEAAAYARALMQSAYTQAYTSMATKAKLTPDDAKAFIAAGMAKSGPDISKVIRLAVPKDENAKAELVLADEAGLGINAKLEIARGNTTVAALQAERANKAAGAAPQTARPPSGATPAAQAPASESTNVSKLTPKERLENQLIALEKFSESIGLSHAETWDFVADWVSERQAEAERQANEGEDAEQASK